MEVEGPRSHIFGTNVSSIRAFFHSPRFHSVNLSQFATSDIFRSIEVAPAESKRYFKRISKSTSTSHHLDHLIRSTLRVTEVHISRGRIEDYEVFQLGLQIALVAYQVTNIYLHNTPVKYQDVRIDDRVFCQSSMPEVLDDFGRVRTPSS
jgi:hypothetical protein